MDPCVSSTTRIPYDILISIIDELALRNQFKELSACSQTCRMLLHPCRVHLFSTANIATNAPQFAATLNQNPAIQVYIQKLTYSTIVMSKVLANAFLLLSNLNTLVLLGRDARRGNFSWIKLTPDIQDALSHLFPSVTRIVIENFLNIPTILLSNYSNLKHLHTRYNTSFTPEICDTPSLTPLKLVSLDIAESPRVAVERLLSNRRADGLPLLDLSNLQSLIICIRSGLKEENHLVQILRSTLKLNHLCLKVQTSVLTPDSLFRVLVRSLSTIRTFKMECNFKIYESVSQIFPQLFKALQALAHHPNNINEINLTLRSGWPWSYTFSQDWERIDQLLADRSTFRQLEKLSIKFRTKLDASESAEEKRINDHLTEFKVTKLARLSSASDDYLDFQVASDDAELYESGWMIFSLRLEQPPK